MTTARDLRVPVLGTIAWGAGLLTHASLELAVATLVIAFIAAVMVALRRGHVTALGWWLAAAAVVGATASALWTVRSSPVRELSVDEATVRGDLIVRSDPRATKSAYGNGVWLRATVTRIQGRGHSAAVRAPVLVLAGQEWRKAAIGQRLQFAGRLAPPEGRDLSGVLLVRGPPRLIGAAPWWHAVAAQARAGIREAVAPRPPGPRALVPALVDGDDAAMAPSLVEDFRATGLTHLVAVSGSNLTIAVGSMLVLARWVGVRGRLLYVIGGAAVLGFVVLARGEPSVIRAAAMGVVGLLALGSNGHERGARALGVAIMGLLVWDPWLAVNVGFALSVSATAGILFLAPGWRDAMAGWMPRPLAEAIAVPLAAQVVCTPLVAGFSGQVSLVAVGANLLVSMVVAPATVCGLVGGIVAMAWPAAGQLIAAPAAWCAGWIIFVAQRVARAPVAALTWPVNWWSMVILVSVCLILAATLVDVLRRRLTTGAVSAVLLLAVLVRPPTPGWPPDKWAMVMCDVGQGDGLVAGVGNGQAMVIDVGPGSDTGAGSDGATMDRCLGRLGVTQVPVLVLSHFHADHVGGLSEVLQNRQVGQIWVTGVADPPGQVRRVYAEAARAQVPVRVVRAGESGRLGAVRWQLVAPSGPPPASSQSVANDGSVVALLRVGGISLLAMGDQEPPSQAVLARVVPQLQVDVLKVAHHGSSKQDTDLITGLGARLGLVSVGADNDYGHPAPATVKALKAAGMVIRRTDRSGDIALVPGTPLQVVTRGTQRPPGR